MTNRRNNVPSKADATIEASPVNMTLFYFRQLADKQNSARLVHICINLLTPTFAIKNLCIQTTAFRIVLKIHMQYLPTQHYIYT
jgi:hypothetical protein